MNVAEFQFGTSRVSFPRIDVARGVAVCVVRHPGERICAHIVPQPIHSILIDERELRKLIETWGGLPGWDIWKFANGNYDNNETHRQPERPVEFLLTWNALESSCAKMSDAMIDDKT